MKKRILIILFFLTFIYICWPLINIYKFYVAVKRYDIEFFEKNINWKTLRAGFKKDLEIIIDEKIGKEKSIEKQLLRSLLGNNLIELILEEIISPKNLVLLLNDPNKYKNMVEKKIDDPKKNNKEMNEIKKKEFKFEGPNFKRISEKINYAFFINFNTFRLDFNHDGYPIKIDMKLQNFKWKIYKIYLPTDFLISKI